MAVSTAVHTGEHVYRNVRFYSNTTLVLDPNASPLPLHQAKEGDTPPKGDENSKVSSTPPPSLFLEPPSRLALLRGEWLLDAWIPTGVDRRTWVAAWGPVRWESGSPREELIHCLYQSWGGEQQGEGEIPQGKCGESWLTCS